MVTVYRSYVTKKVEGFADFADYYAIIETETDNYKYILQVIDDTQHENKWLVRGFINANDELMYWEDYWYDKDENMDDICMKTAAKLDMSTDALTSEIYNFKIENNL